MGNEQLFGGIEAGGTKFICIIGTGPDDIRSRVQISTTTPQETLSQVIHFFKTQTRKITLAGLGIASFGPLDLNPTSSTHGYITNTPKAGWSNTSITGTLRSALGIPVFIDTDVNAAALGEKEWGEAQGLDSFLYVTVGTGIGGGGFINGAPLHGLLHPEMGHIRIPHDYKQDPFPGRCPFHGDCWEGLASGTALQQRWGKPAYTLPPEHLAWSLEAHYLALGVSNLICTLSPQRIILGGGLLHNTHLLALIQHQVQSLLNHYIASPLINDRIEDYLVLPGLGEMSGALGALALARQVPH